MNQQPYQGLMLLTPTTAGNWLTNGKSYSQRLYVKPEEVGGWKEITPAEYAAAVPTRPDPRAAAQAAAQAQAPHPRSHHRQR